ncbi:uncharacterized protein LOC102807925 [Saccoglossus kowalevskii]
MGKETRCHSCHKNWLGSLKAMGTDIAVEAIKETEQKGEIASITMDRLQTKIKNDKVKNNHTKKGFTNKLYKLKEDYKQLLTKVINYLQKCFSYAISQNRDSVSSMQKNLKSIIPHAFGDHTHCYGSWCQYLVDPANYKHSSLPYGKELCSDDLRASSDKIMKTYIDSSNDLARMGSTQGNENMNMVIASKAPKAKHYSGSDSFNVHIAAAVAQKDIGHTYVCQVGSDAEITQLSAVTGERQFEGYILPKQQSSCFQDNSSDDVKNPILVGHNRFMEVVSGFVNTLPLFKSVYPGEDSYAQQSLVGEFVGQVYSLHNASVDVLALQN